MHLILFFKTLQFFLTYLWLNVIFSIVITNLAGYRIGGRKLTFCLRHLIQTILCNSNNFWIIRRIFNFKIIKRIFNFRIKILTRWVRTLSNFRFHLIRHQRILYLSRIFLWRQDLTGLNIFSYHFRYFVASLRLINQSVRCVTFNDFLQTWFIEWASLFQIFSFGNNVIS